MAFDIVISIPGDEGGKIAESPAVATPVKRFKSVRIGVAKAAPPPGLATRPFVVETSKFLPT